MMKEGHKDVSFSFLKSFTFILEWDIMNFMSIKKGEKMEYEVIGFTYLYDCTNGRVLQKNPNMFKYSVVEKGNPDNVICKFRLKRQALSFIKRKEKND